jgi:hypothetical protein
VASAAAPAFALRPPRRELPDGTPSAPALWPGVGGGLLVAPRRGSIGETDNLWVAVRGEFAVIPVSLSLYAPHPTGYVCFHARTHTHSACTSRHACPILFIHLPHGQEVTMNALRLLVRGSG